MSDKLQFVAGLDRLKAVGLTTKVGTSSFQSSMFDRRSIKNMSTTLSRMRSWPLRVVVIAISIGLVAIFSAFASGERLSSITTSDSNPVDTVAITGATLI